MEEWKDHSVFWAMALELEREGVEVEVSLMQRPCCDVEGLSLVTRANGRYAGLFMGSELLHFYMQGKINFEPAFFKNKWPAWREDKSQWRSLIHYITKFSGSPTRLIGDGPEFYRCPDPEEAMSILTMLVARNRLERSGTMTS